MSIGHSSNGLGRLWMMVFPHDCALSSTQFYPLSARPPNKHARVAASKIPDQTTVIEYESAEYSDLPSHRSDAQAIF